MADIFVSYASSDLDRVTPIVAGLEKAGYSVWWDQALRGGSRFAKEIEIELKAAKVVLAVWSAGVSHDTVPVRVGLNLPNGVHVRGGCPVTGREREHDLEIQSFLDDAIDLGIRAREIELTFHRLDLMPFHRPISPPS